MSARGEFGRTERESDLAQVVAQLADLPQIERADRVEHQVLGRAVELRQARCEFGLAVDAHLERGQRGDTAGQRTAARRAIVALFHDLIITTGVYGVLGLEITPAAVIGFLTILGYSLYDTVVVFDKVRENTSEDGVESRRTFAQSVNLAVNQTLVRSINTSVVAVLPTAAILFIGSLLLGAGTLRDIALALFIGTLVGTYSSIFLAAPLYVHLRENEPEVKKQGSRQKAARPESGAVR